GDSPIPEQRAIKDLSGRFVRLPALWVQLSTFRQFSQEFRVTWQGSVLAPETGEYEFLVRTENAARLWVNDLVRPLIDAAVKSGNDTDYRQSVFLLGGRGYPLRVGVLRGQGEAAAGSFVWKRP